MWNYCFFKVLNILLLFNVIIINNEYQAHVVATSEEKWKKDKFVCSKEILK